VAPSFSTCQRRTSPATTPGPLKLSWRRKPWTVGTRALAQMHGRRRAQLPK
jgi:hypothetical protein